MGRSQDSPGHSLAPARASVKAPSTPVTRRPCAANGEPDDAAPRGRGLTRGALVYPPHSVPILSSVMMRFPRQRARIDSAVSIDG